MRRPHNYPYKKRAESKGAELRGIEVWIRRYCRGYKILLRAFEHEHGRKMRNYDVFQSDAWSVATHELILEMEKLHTKRANLRCAPVTSGTPIAFPSLTGPLFPKA
jgi:hypothetical protein